ncbi:uncharacterized protein LOC132271685 [Cornus florida]|uniref:uncharacterized protein LOC132271685 n=1 Tax=Cornus florida TaxID=4283 RepID=UPI00289C8FBD|nr:uncharacterized protein LOC132271685 [Cornus florida]
MVSNSKLVSPGSVDYPAVGSSRATAPLHDLDQIDVGKSYPLIFPTANGNDRLTCGNVNLASPPLKQSSFNSGYPVTSRELCPTGTSSGEESYIVNSPSSLKSGSLSTERTIAREVQSSNSVVTGEGSNTSSDFEYEHS